MDIGKAFGSVFQDERWVSKVAIGGLITIVPILNFAAIGYALQVARNVAQGSTNPLPEWSDLGDHFMRGLYGVVIGLVYNIPGIILYCVYYAAIIAAAAGASADDSGAAGAAGGLFACILLPLMLIAFIVGTILTFAGFARYVATNTLSEALKIGEVIRMVRNRPGPWLMIFLVYFLASFIAGFGIIACFIGVIFTGFIAYCVVGHALGQTIAEQGLLGTNPYATQPIPPSYGPPPTYQ